MTAAIVEGVIGILLMVLPWVIEWYGRQTDRVEEGKVNAEVRKQMLRKALQINDGVGVDGLAADQHDRVQQILAFHRGGGGRANGAGSESNPGQPLQ